MQYKQYYQLSITVYTDYFIISYCYSILHSCVFN